MLLGLIGGAVGYWVLAPLHDRSLQRAQAPSRVVGTVDGSAESGQP
jgi:hypothetical protein